MVEDPEPGGGAVGGSGQLPVDQPECADFFEIGVQAARTEEQFAKRGGADEAAAIVANVLAFLEYACHQPPVAYGSHHVLTYAEGDQSIVLQKNIRLLSGSIDGFLEPAVAERKCLMTGKLRKCLGSNGLHGRRTQ